MYLIRLEKEYNAAKVNVNSESENIRMIFSDYTLKQLVFLKNNLKWKKSNVDTFTGALVLGAMHGNSESYFSVSMPNTFSMAPNYVKKYIANHSLQKPDRDVFAILKKRLDRCYQRPTQKGKVYNQNVTNMSRVKNETVDLIITSPPYTRVIRYGQFNWIRLWFFSMTGKEVDEKLFFSQSIDKYCNFMTQALQEMKRVLKKNSKAVLVIGDVKHRTSEEIFNLAEIVWARCAKPLGFKLVVPIMADVISDDTKVSKIWGDKRGNATRIDRILILSNS